MKKNVTLADVARRSKVSTSTASLALREKPGIPPETRERVLRAAQALGYRTRSPLTHLGSAASPSGHLQNLGLLVKANAGQAPHANPFYAYVLAGIEDACRRRKINLLYATLPVDENNLPAERPHLLMGHYIDGLLLVGAFVDETLLHTLGKISLPVVLVDAYARAGGYDAVLTDNRRGAYELTQFLVARGHRRIAFVGGSPEAYPSLRERREGYAQALRDLAGGEPCFADCAANKEAATEATRALLTVNPDVTAVLGCNDEVAIAVMLAAQTALGRQLPGDLSVVGFDDIDLSEHVAPALTTMHVDKLGLGRLAVQILRSRVEFPEADTVRVVVQPRLVERQSVRALAPVPLT